MAIYRVLIITAKIKRGQIKRNSPAHGTWMRTSLRRQMIHASAPTSFGVCVCRGTQVVGREKFFKNRRRLVHRRSFYCCCCFTRTCVYVRDTNCVDDGELVAYAR